MDDEQLLLELEGLLRNTPSQQTIRQQIPENFSWLGRAAAALEAWNSVKGMMAKVDINNIQSSNIGTYSDGYRKTLTIIHQAIHELRMKTVGPLSIAIGTGGVFNYFDEIRKILESANEDVLFIDPYLDAEFVSRYLPNIKDGVLIRLLGREKIKTLIPSVEAYAAQHKQKIEIRSAKGFHDRYIFIDHGNCYQSGATFQDGAKKSPTTLTQITDAFPAVKSTYEEIWNNGNIKFSN
jgi:hypothetical protein